MTKRLSNPGSNALYQVELWGLKLVVALFRALPLDPASAMMGWLWKKIAPLTHRHKRALGHLEMALPELEPADREEILRGMWDNLGRVAVETFHIPELLNQPERFELVLDEGSQAVFDTHAPCLFVSLHCGNWELSVLPAVLNRFPMAGVYQALKNPGADQLLRDMRGDLYPGGLFSKGPETARKLMALAKNKSAYIAIMADLKEKRGLDITFFGQKATATPVPATLARSGNLPIIVGRVSRLEGVRFRVEGRLLPVLQTADRKADIQAATQAYHDIFEQWIREDPKQWMWIHRKWA
ncbi:lauroyl acyltransferase [Roseibium sp. CAU 1637]|uniref:Lauroyl acyltransferase n=1 Tax=Roseibium limicola TaxID=2816037 RepID=A0A939EL40_9HYPH|nr:lauroyl acyltransferase [Roseibium limicola]MBO0344427.1 lauroyl acyltransferase [Roseibium limicola]